MKLASISDLKDNLSAYLELARSGEVVVVTDRKSPVATLERIVPGTLWGNTLALVAEGTVAPRKTPLDLDGFFALPRGSAPAGLAAAVIEERGESR